MTRDNFQKAWGSPVAQGRLSLEPDLVLEEVERKQRAFSTMLFWRDLREVGTAVVMIPLWIFLGLWHPVPWTWFLTVPALAWFAGFMLVDRRRHGERLPASGDTLHQRVESLLKQVEHQIWLLRNVFWWGLLPLAIPMLAFIIQVTWSDRDGGWFIVLGAGMVIGFCALLFAFVYWLNQRAVRVELEPRRQELQALLTSLSDDTAAG